LSNFKKKDIPGFKRLSSEDLSPRRTLMSAYKTSEKILLISVISFDLFFTGFIFIGR
jgi:hypothetical protein